MPESEIEQQPADRQTACQGGVRQAQPGGDVCLLLQDAGPEVLLRAGDDGHVGGVLGDLVYLGVGRDAERGVEVVVRGVGLVAVHQAGHVGARGDAESLLCLEAGVTDSPGQDWVAGHHQVVDAEGYQGAVVRGHTRRAQDLPVTTFNITSQ